jgi:hypothetical protein
MTKEDISIWLNSSDHNWKEGLALFVAYSNNKHMSRVLMSKSPTARSMKTLQYELNKIVRASPSIPKPLATKKGKSGQRPDLPLKPVTLKLPGEPVVNPAITALQVKIKAKFVEAASIFYQLRYMKAYDCRLSCLRILDLMAERDKYWQQLDYITKFGALPSAQDVVSHTELKDKLNNLRTYISKHKANIKKAKTAETREKYQRKMDEMILERDSLEAKLSTNATL